MLELLRWVHLKRAPSLISVLLFSAVAFVPAASAQKGGVSLEILPIRIDVKAPVVSRSVLLRNGGNRPMKMQVRVFKWIQKDGKSYYLPTNDVAVSPPILTMRSRSESTLRVLRVSRQPLKMQESYRIVIDQLPDSSLKQKGSSIGLLLRHQLPAFFAPAGDVASQVQWRALPVKGGYQITATNSGNIYKRVVSVKLLAHGKVVGSQDGFVSYVLAGSSTNFFIPGSGRKPDRIQMKENDGTTFEDVIH